MLINPFVYGESSIRSYDPQVIKKAHIVHRNRLIYILNESTTPIDLISIFGNRQKFYIVVINYAQTKIRNIGLLNTKSYYILTSFCTQEDITKRFLDQQFDLKYVFTTGFETMIINDKKAYIDLGTCMADDFFSHTGPRSINFDDMYSDSVDANSQKLNILDPRYYNRKHYELDTGYHYEDIPALKNYSFLGRELLDDATSLIMTKTNITLSQYESVQIYQRDQKNLPVLITNERIIWNSFEQQAYVNNFPLNMFQINHESFFSSYIAHYDTKYGGFNIKNIYFPKEYISKERVADYYREIRQTIEQFSKQMYNHFGHIRLNYYFSNIKEIVTVEFDEAEFSKMTYFFRPEEMLQKADVANFWYKYEDEVERRFKHHINWDLLPMNY